jgi:putative oxidoreductase
MAPYIDARRRKLAWPIGRPIGCHSKCEVKMLPFLMRFQDAGILLLRLMVSVIFFSSGWAHVRDPGARSKRIGMSKGFTAFLGTAEIAGSLGVAVGVLPQAAAMGLILIMLGAISKKVFVWHTGFWGKDGYGWHYDLMIVVMNIVIIVTDGGRYILIR